ncbi:MAG TPA: hypothetical protein VLH79_15675 [Chthonomonadales bacterium]|nr:hypothetical protein [Chthonomonadales bacterium]
MIRTRFSTSALRSTRTGVFQSGDTVPPGVYVDVVSGAVVRMLIEDVLPDGVKLVRYVRRFSRLTAAEASPEEELARAA